ncbi:MAG: transglutaminase domain-containing protein [Raoultibacter sp.]
MNRPRLSSIFASPTAVIRTVCSMLLGYVLVLGPLTSCSSSEAGAPGGPAVRESKTDGPAFSRPELALSTINLEALSGTTDAGIDVSNASSGYVNAVATSDNRLKFQVTMGTMEYYYDMPSDGTPIAVPINGGSGSYTFQIMQNTRSNLYAALGDAVTVDVQLTDEFQPFIRPNVYCSYDENSLVVQKANELAANAENQGDVLASIYSWIVENVRYDEEKAEGVVNGTIADGYIPNPDATLQAKTGICFDYASLAAAMLRSQGIPCKIITGDVSPDSIYHAWNMVYLNGTWINARMNVDSGTWTRIDFTFAAGGATAYAGDGMSYTDKFTY